MSNTNSSKLHHGHRKRMLDKYKKLGAEAFAPHELLEMLLYWSLAGINTNEQAHQLIADCNGLDNVLKASREKLCETKGIGERTSALIKLCSDVVRCADLERAASVPLTSQSRICRYVESWFRNKQKSTVMAVFLDKNRMVIDAVTFSEGRRRRALDYSADISDTAQRLEAKSVILAHNHSDNVPSPSVNDISLTSDIRISLAGRGISLVDHYIVTDYECTPISKAKEIHDEEFNPLS